MLIHVPGFSVDVLSTKQETARMLVDTVKSYIKRLLPPVGFVTKFDSVSRLELTGPGGDNDVRKLNSRSGGSKV